MSYIGQQLPADVFSGYVTDTFTGDGSATTFTLSKAPFSEDSLIVVVDNVIQQPTTNFTVSGTTLTIVGTAILSGIKGYAIHTGGAVPSTLASKVDVNGLSDGVILDADADTTISADTDDQIDFKAGGTDVMSMTATGLTINDGTTITTADNTDTLSLISTDADANSGPNLLLDRNSSSTANQDVIGVITYRGRNDAGQEVDYVQLESRLGDETDGTEDANFKFKHMNAGTLREYISTNHAEICFNEDSIDLDLRVETNGAEYGLFVDGGNDLVNVGGAGSGSGSTDARLVFFTAGQFYQYMASNSTTDFQRFYNSDTGSEVGSIEGNASSVAFRTSSDYRLKENVDYSWDATTRLKQLKPARFNWIADDTNTPVDGFLAHEVSSVVPEAVGGEKDAVDDDGKIIPQGIDQSKLVPLMVKTIQELEARIKTLEDA